MCPTRSVWTIDLAFLLNALGARVQMLTVTLGANQASAAAPPKCALGAGGWRVATERCAGLAGAPHLWKRLLPLAAPSRATLASVAPSSTCSSTC